MCGKNIEQSDFKLCKTSFILGATYALAKDMKSDGSFEDMEVSEIVKILLENITKGDK